MKFPLDHTSYSQLSLYQHCPRCYYLSYVLGIKVPKSDNLEFGSNVHSALEHYHKSNGKIKDNIDRRIRRIVEIYSEKFAPDYLDEVEKGMIVIFKHPDTQEPLALPFKLYIDGIKLNGQFIVVDHKTSAFPYTQSKVNKEWQVTLYSYAFRTFYGVKEDRIQYNIFVKPRNRESDNFQMQTLFTRRDRSDYADFWYWGKNLLDKMGQGHFDPSSHTGMKCDFCKVCTTS